MEPQATSVYQVSMGELGFLGSREKQETLVGVAAWDPTDQKYCLLTKIQSPSLVSSWEFCDPEATVQSP